MVKKLMILGASELQIPAIICANSLGIKSIVLDYNENAIGRKFAYKFYTISTLNYEGVLEIAKKENINGILTICSDRPMPIIAKIGEVLGLNTISYETALKSTNKRLMRKALFENNVPIPKFFICKTFEDVKKAVDSLSRKCILKPSNNSGSRGIYLYYGHSNLSENYEYTKKYSTDNIILVEEFMEGPEVSVEVFVINEEINIIQITDKITTGAPYFVEMGHTQPSSLASNIQNEIKEIAKEGVSALGIKNGPAHVEIIITNQGPKIVEIGARLGGDHITTDLVPLSTGVDMVNLSVKDALKLPVSLKNISAKYSAIRYINKELVIPEKLKDKMIYHFDKNKESIEIKSSNDRLGYIILHADSKYELENMLIEIPMIGEGR